MSTQGQPAAPWREEVNRRLAEHNRRKGTPSPASAPARPAGTDSSLDSGLGASRAAQAAARVAARYSKAKSYSQMQAEEARIAVRNAEIATQVALQAQSAAESALAELHAATVEPPPPAELIPFEAAAHHFEPVAEPELLFTPEPEPDPEAELAAKPEAVVEPLPEPQFASSVAAPVADAAPAVPAPEWDWSTDAVTPAAAAKPRSARRAAPRVSAPTVEAVQPPVAVPEPAPVAAPEIPVAGPVTDARATSGQVLQIRWEPDMPMRSSKPAAEAEPFELAAEDWWTAAEPVPDHAEPVQIEAHDIPANLIQFPRELVATRRIRPRNVESPAPEPGAQLSIFEVDPGSIQTEAPAPAPAEEWTEPAWSSSAEPVVAGVESDSRLGRVASEWSVPEWSGMKLGAHSLPEATPVLANKLALAPITSRLLAGLVDGSIAVAIATFLWLTLALGMAHTLTPRIAELLGAGALALAALAYHAFFCLIAMPTPGMRYAGLSVLTFEDTHPTPAQLRRRFGAMIVSTLPMGLGMAWSLFDEDHLAWHDRHSQTYLRQN